MSDGTYRGALVVLLAWMLWMLVGMHAARRRCDNCKRTGWRRWMVPQRALASDGTRRVWDWWLCRPCDDLNVLDKHTKSARAA